MLEGRRCLLFFEESPRILLVEPMDSRDLDFLPRELDYLRENVEVPFALASFIVEDWNMELAPWPAPAVFGKEPFGDGAGVTLEFIENHLIPEARVRLSSMENCPIVIGGYSLAALFALWCAYESDSFDAVAAASPSVWYPGWMDFARGHVPKVGSIYLSLGDTEEKTRNRVMATVGECIREQDSILSESGISHTLEWNPGNHFKDADLRTARAFSWCAGSVSLSVR